MKNTKNTFDRNTYHKHDFQSRIKWVFALKNTPLHSFPFISRKWLYNFDNRSLITLFKIAFKITLLGNGFEFSDYEGFVEAVQISENLEELIYLTSVFLTYTDRHNITCLSSLLSKFKLLSEHTNVLVEFTPYERTIIHHFLFMIKYRKIKPQYHIDSEIL